MSQGYPGNPGSAAVTVPDKAELNRWRVIAAFVFAPLLASLAFAIYEPAYDGIASYPERVLRSAVIYMVVGALLPTVVLGIPAFMILKKVFRPTVFNCALIGAVIAAVPWFFLGLTPGADSASIGGRATVIAGEYTDYGWRQFGQSLLIIGAARAVGGAIFWFIVAAKMPRRFS